MARSLEKKREQRTKTHVVQNRALTPGLSAWAMRTPFLPESLTRYIATSAARTNSSAEAATSGSVATPTDAVRRTFKPVAREEADAPPRAPGRDRPTAAAPSEPVSGRTIANSSPPNRATMSVSRARPANHRRGFDQGPAAGQVAVRVVDALEPVEVEEQQRQRTARTRGALGFPPQHLVQVAGVVELRQVVGDRQRLGPPQPQGVVERLRRPFERRPEQLAHRRRHARHLGRGRRSSNDQGAHGVRPAPQRPAEHRAARRRAPAESLRRSADAELTPVSQDPARDADGRGRQRRAQAASTTAPTTCPSRSAAKTPHAGALNHSSARADHQLANRFRIERGRARRASSASTDSGRSSRPLSAALAAPQPGGQIRTARTAVSHSTD